MSLAPARFLFPFLFPASSFPSYSTLRPFSLPSTSSQTPVSIPVPASILPPLPSRGPSVPSVPFHAYTTSRSGSLFYPILGISILPTDSLPRVSPREPVRARTPRLKNAAVYPARYRGRTGGSFSKSPRESVTRNSWQDFQEFGGKIEEEAWSLAILIRGQVAKVSPVLILFSTDPF